MIRILSLLLVLVAAEAWAFQTLPSDRINQAEALMKERNFKAANVIFHDLAEAGNPYAMYHLGRAYGRGWGLEKDPALGLDWLKQAYSFKFDKRGMAAYEVGRLYQTQKVVQDYKQAVSWFWQALHQGYPKAHVQLAVLMEGGLGAEPNMKGALYHLERAAHHDYPQSQIAYARKLQSGAYGPADGREVASWTNRAIKTLERQARRGSATAATRLGKLYMADDLVPFNADRARKWLKLGRKLGNRWAPEYLKKLDAQSK